ncbi:MAG: translocation protein TolB precursor [[Actinobacillus] rossii]|nr:translocation protein TolB precursor [[Actinobacillus] rossii]
MNYKLKIRCSGIADIIGIPTPKKDRDQPTKTAKSAIRKIAKYDLYGYRDFDGNKQTEKGLQLEDTAIKLSGFTRGLALKKNTERRENDWITGECDIYVPSRKLIIDEKCSWDIGTHPFFEDEAEEKAIKAGYDWQMQGYMWLWDCQQAQIDFVLLPTPIDLLSIYDSVERHIDLVEQIPQRKRITSVTIKRDDKKIELIKERVEVAQKYYEELVGRYDNSI